MAFGTSNFGKLKTAEGDHGDIFCIEFHSNPSRSMESRARNMESKSRNTFRFFGKIRLSLGPLQQNTCLVDNF